MPITLIFGTMVGRRKPNNDEVVDDFGNYADYAWLVVWNMNFMFPNSWDDDPI